MLRPQLKQLVSSTGLLEPARQIRRSLSVKQRVREYGASEQIYVGFQPDHTVVHCGNAAIWLNASVRSEPLLRGMVDHFHFHHSAVAPRLVDGVSVADFSKRAVHRLTRLGGEVELTFHNDYIAIRKGEREIRIRPSHHVYVWDMGNFFDYYHGAVVPEMRNGVAVVDYSRPKLHQLRRSGVEFEFPSLPESDESTEPYLSILQPKEGDAILDLGAYAGASAFFLSRAVGPSGLIVSLEPDATNFRYLQANIARHQLRNVKPVQKGVWKERGTLAFQAEGSMGSSVVEIIRRDSSVKKVEVMTLEDAAALLEGRTVAAVKMDIEGAELAVLQNSAEFLRRHRARFIVEVHFIDGVQPVEEVCEIFRAADYSVDLPLQGTGGGGLVAAWPNSAHLPK